MKGRAELILLRLHVWSEPSYRSTVWWRHINLWSHCFDTRRSVQATVILLLPSTLIHAWRWQHLSSKKPFLCSVSHLSFFKLTCHSSLLSIQFFPMDFSVSLGFLVHIDRSPAENRNTVLTKVSAVLIWFISLYCQVLTTILFVLIDHSKYDDKNLWTCNSEFQQQRD